MYPPILLRKINSYTGQPLPGTEVAIELLLQLEWCSEFANLEMATSIFHFATLFCDAHAKASS